MTVQSERANVSENCGGIPVASLAHFPTFCAPVLKDDDPSLAMGINFWAVEPIGDAEIDYALGDLYGQEAVCFLREHEPSFLTCVFMWMGARLLDDERCPGPLELGFIERVRTQRPDAIDRVVMDYYRYLPGKMN
jgi:hypothetical protein